LGSRLLSCHSRFMPSQDPEPWTGFVADRFQPSCVQQFSGSYPNEAA
jgi:carboxylesterase type B